MMIFTHSRAGISVLAVFLFFQWIGVSNVRAEASAEVRTAIAQSGSLQKSVLAYGTLASNSSDTRTIILQHDGVVEDVLIRVGDVVEKDEVLFQIAATPLAASQFAQIKSSFNLAKKELARLKRLKAVGLASNDQIANAEKAFSDAQAQLSAQTKIGVAEKTNIIRAPFSGVVTMAAITPGDQVVAGSVIAMIGGRDRLIASLGLEPEDAGKLKKGAHVLLSFPLDSGAKISGTLISIGGMIDPQSRLVPATATLDEDLESVPILGSTMVAQIFLPEKQGIRVPRSAVLEDADGPYLFADEGGRAVRHNIKISVETDQFSLIESGISSGAKIIVAGNAALEEGVLVHEGQK